MVHEKILIDDFIPKRIVLDPSFVLRTRGITWMLRARRIAPHSFPVWASGTLMHASLAAKDDDIIELETAYKGVFRHSARYLGDSCAGLPIHHYEESYFSSQPDRPGYVIAGETFAATLRGGILASRRFTAMELLVRSDDIRIVWCGPRFYDFLQRGVESLLPEPLGSALLRRVRFLSIATITDDGPLLFTGDNGWSSAR